MTEKSDAFRKSFLAFQSKYKMTIDGLLSFLMTRIDSSANTLEQIKDKILSYQEKSDHITQEQYYSYLHLIAAAQAKGDFKDKSLEELQKYKRIKYLTKEEMKKRQQQQLQGEQKNKEEKPEKVNEQVKQEPKPKKQEKSKRVQEKQPKKEASKVSQVPNAPKTSQVHSPTKTLQVNPKISQTHSPTKKEKLPEKAALGVIVQNVIQEDRSSTVVKSSSSEQFFAKFPEAQLLKMRTTSLKHIQIRGYDKFGQNYLNPIIKFKIDYKDSSVYRRYTQFDNLMKYLNKRYEGFILPQLPPKEGIKSNLSYFRGIDQAFLNERQVKLQQMLNTLMNSRYTSEEQVFIRFLTDQDYEVQAEEATGTLSYLKSLGQIAFNAKQLKTYGMAYYNYLKSFKKSDINTKVIECYQKAQPILSYCLTLQNYRTNIITNLDKRRQIFRQLEVDQNDRTLTITQFDKLSGASAGQVRNLQKQMNKYYELKSQESWLSYLQSQKQIEHDQNKQQIKKRHEELKSRISRMQYNLIQSIDSLVRSKNVFLEQIGSLIVDWRKSIHP